MIKTSDTPHLMRHNNRNWMDLALKIFAGKNGKEKEREDGARSGKAGGKGWRDGSN